MVPGEVLCENEIVLQLTLNPLDVSSQKSKVNVGRSGSIGGRRPPSRPRSLLAPRRADSAITEEGANPNPELDRLSQMSELCKQFHEQTKHQILESSIFNKDDLEVEIANPRIELPPEDLLNGVNAKKKSCSTEDLTKDDKGSDSEPAWSRGSNVRRSLQFPSKVPSDFPLVTSVSKLRQEIESRKNVTSHVPKTSPEFDVLEGVLKRVMEKKSIFEKQVEEDSTLERMGRLSQADYESKTGKTNGVQGHSFVTVEKLNEVRGKLKRMGTESDEDLVPMKKDEPPAPDDGIVTEDHVLRPNESPSASPSRVMSYVFGMEAMMNGKKTGSLESKKISFNGNRSEEWYNRRKSYGFEQVHSQQESKNQLKSTVESSTDSGICRSSETMTVPSWTKMLNGSSPEERKVSCYNEPMPKSLTAYLSKKFDSEESAFPPKRNVVDLSSKWRDSDLSDMERRRDALSKSSALSANLRSNRISEGSVFNRPITISLPVGSNAINRQTDDISNEEADSDPLRPRLTDSTDIKRHSIAVDETRYVLDTIKRLSSQPDLIRRNPSTAFLNQRSNTKSMDVGSHFMIQDNDDHNKKKKVEFCKTEVHFAAEPGRFNLVSTDDKPPPTHIIRGRRRKNPTERFNHSGLPELRFGDSVYEKQLLTCDDPKELEGASPLSEPEADPEQNGDADDRLNAEDRPRSILKNFAKPQEYILGGDANFSESPYGVTPMWRSTVTLRNTTFSKQNSASENEPIRNGSLTSELTSPSAVQLVSVLYLSNMFVRRFRIILFCVCCL